MKNRIKCAAHWRIDSKNIGRCLFYKAGRTCGRNGGGLCPYKGVRDFNINLDKVLKKDFGKVKHPVASREGAR